MAETDQNHQLTCCAKAVAPIAGATKERIAIDFLYLDLRQCDRCKGTYDQLEAVLPIVREVLEASGFEVEVRRIHVQTMEQAAALGFAVSPTIRVNHRDIQLNWRETPCAPCSKGCEAEVSCREWEYGGQWYPIPPKELLIRSILREAYGPAREEPAAPRATQVSENLKRFFAKRPCCETSG